MAGLTHIDANGHAVMVDVGGKAVTERTALAKGRICMSPEAFAAIREGTAKKGDVLGVARVAGIMAAKRTSDLIPLCHPLAMTHCSVDFELLEHEHAVEAACMTRVTGRTGIEMEAMTGVSVALLTIYDMCKAVDRSMRIEQIRLVHKEGGKSGTYDRAE